MIHIKSAQYMQQAPSPMSSDEYRHEYSDDQAVQEHYDRYNVYYISETLTDPATGQETQQISNDGYTSVEEAAEIARNGLQDSIDQGATSVDIVHRDEGWVHSVWDKEDQDQSVTHPMNSSMDPRPMLNPTDMSY